MPIHKSWSSLIKGLNSQYCGKKAENDVPAPFKCKKSRSIFYAIMRKNGWDETKRRPTSSKNDDDNLIVKSKDLLDTKYDLQYDDSKMSDVDMGRLTYKARQKLKSSEFCDPENKRYPAHDAAHVRNGIARIRQHPNDPKYKSILKCLIRRAKKFGIKVSEDVRKSAQFEPYPDSDFVLIRENGDKFFQIRRNGLLDPQMLLDSLKTVDFVCELTDDEWKEAKTKLMDTARQYIEVMYG